MSGATPSIAFLGDVGLGPDALMELAREAEQSGFAGAWMVEYEYDSLAFVQALLMATTTLAAGSCVARIGARPPLLVAQNAAVLDLLAPGRYAIGLGSGPRSRGAATEPDRPVARMREYVGVIRAALAEEMPIYLAAGGPQMARLAGRRADGLFVYLASAAETRVTRSIAVGAARQAGRDADRLAVFNLIPTCVGEDREQAREALRAYLLDYYLHLPHYQGVLARLGFPDTLEALRDSPGDTKRPVSELLADPRVRAAAESIPDGFLDERTIAGTATDCRRRVRELRDEGIERPILYVFPPGDDWEAGYRAALAAFAGAGRHDPLADLASR